MDYKIKSRIWIEVDDHVFLGEGRIQLLKAIDNTGSLSKAAKELKMSYKKAWNLLDKINKSADEPVVISNVGGKNGGGATLTDYGRTMIATFDKINKQCWAFLNKQQKKLEEL